MAGLCNADPRHRLTVDAPPPPIAKDMHGSDSSVPLSPQWLLPKLRDNKLGLASGEVHLYVGKHSEPVKVLGNAEEHNVAEKKKDVFKPSIYDSEPVKVLGNAEEHNVAEKKKDVFKPSIYDTEHGRWDHWHDEERAANSAVRRDHRREGEELVASRKADRWSDSSFRYSVEARHFPSERWTDSGNKESTYEQRRDSKWNSRWGPEDKESENWREKLSGKDGESTRDKVSPNVAAIHGKDIKYQSRDTDKEGEHHSQSWRSSPSINRSRVESSPYVPPTTNKLAPMFGYGRGKGENGPILNVGRNWAYLSTSSATDGPSRHFHLGNASDRSSGSHGDALVMRYSRMKLLDIYRTTDLKGYKLPSEGFQEVPSLMRAKPLEPLALTAPIAEELAILKAIDKGEIVASGVPRASTDGSTGKNSIDSGLLLPTKSGIGENAAPVVSDHRAESINNGNIDNSCYKESALYEKCSYLFDSEVSRKQNLHQYHEDKLTAETLEFGAPPDKACESSTREVSKLESTIPWRSQLVSGASLQSSNDPRGLDGDRSGSTNMGLLNTQKHAGIEQRNSYDVSSTYLRSDPQWQDTLNLPLEVRNKSQIRRQTSKIIEQEREGLLNVHGQDDPFIFRHKLADRKSQPYLLPEDLSLFYRDPHGEIQGPFSGSNLIGWFDAGYFGIDLQVRLAGAPADAPFSLLGDVIPQLRTRVRPPPGFGTPRLNDIVDVANRGNFVGSSSVHAGVAQFELMKNGQVLGNETKVEAENRFLESLMSRRTSSSLSESCLLPEGMQGYDGFAGVGSLSGTENMSDMKQLSRKMSLEQQSTVPTPCWPGRAPPAILSKTDPIPDPSFHPPKYLLQIEEASRHFPRSPQNLNLQSQPVPSSLPLWPSFSEAQALKNAHGKMDFLKDSNELHYSLQNTHTGFGTPNLETQSQPLPNLNPLGNHSSGVMLQEKSVAPELSQDPQVINLLQHQYMLNQQVHSQVPPLTHLNMELLLLMQRQKQEQQLNQMLLQQKQQQQFLAHALSGHQSHQYFDEPSLGHLNAGVVDEKASLSNPILQQMHEMVQNKHQMHVLDSRDSVASNLSKLNLHDAQDASFTVCTSHLPLNLPNQFLKPTSHPNAMDSTPSLDVGRTENSDTYQIASLGDSLVSAEDGSVQDPFLSQINTRDIDTSVASQGLSQTNEMVTIASDAVNNLVLSNKGTRNLDLTPTVSEKIDDVKISPNTISGQAFAESPGSVVVEVKEPQELKKVPEKKSRKQKNSQLRAVSEHGKGPLKAAPSQHSRINLETRATKKGIHIEVLEPLYRAPEAKSENFAPSAMESLDSASAHLLSSGGFIDKKTEVNEGKVESEFGLSLSKAWKAAPGQKRKSLLEIQREEQRRVHTESLASDILPEITMTNASVIPLVGSINPEQKYALDTVHGVISPTRPVAENPGNPLNSKNTRSPLQDVFAEEALAKPGGKDTNGIEEQRESLPPLTQAGSHIGEFVTAFDDFVQTKETRKGRKKAMKNKGASGNASVPVTSADLSVYANTTDKTKAIRQTEQNKESLPGPPAAPSFGDFVLWKTDQASSVPAPAWSSDAAKLQKPTSLRDILKEQDKQTKSGPQQIPIPTAARVQPTRGNGGSSSSWQVSGSSPSKVAFPLNSKSASSAQTGSHSLGQPNMATEYDLFWGPLDQAKQGSSSASSKEVQGTPVKESYGEGSNRKASSSKAADHSIVSSPAVTQFLSKGKKNSESKYTEAMDFRDWCEGEWLRLTGTSDTSFLEFILKQTSTEAEALLRENLGSLDPSHEFIDKFINYKEFLSAEVIEIAFRGQRRSKEDHAQASHGTRVSREGVDGVADGSTKGKKGKKGKKLSPALLGFNVVSNRIMMGEIQTIED